jgi:hypothetical protein
MDQIIGGIFLLSGIYLVVVPHTAYLEGKSIKRIITLFSYPFVFGYAVILMGIINIFLQEPFSNNAGVFGFSICILHFSLLKARNKKVW